MGQVNRREDLQFEEQSVPIVKGNKSDQCSAAPAILRGTAEQLFFYMTTMGRYSGSQRILRKSSFIRASSPSC